MPRRSVTLGIVAALALPLLNAAGGAGCARLQATDLGGYVVGAGLGVVLGSLLYRNNGQYYQSNGSRSSLNSANYQPKVVNGYYWDGYAASYGPIVVPPPGYVQPQVVTDSSGGLSVPAATTPAPSAPAPPVPAGAAPGTALLPHQMMPQSLATLARPGAMVGGRGRPLRNMLMRQMLAGQGRASLNMLRAHAGRHLGRFF